MENVFVTVGTTRFDKLVATVLSEPVIDVSILHQINCNQIN